MTIETPAADSGEFDLDSAVEDIGSSLGFGDSPDDEVDLDAPEKELVAAVVDKAATDLADTAPAVREMPKSWSKDKAEMWSKLAPDAQDYYGVREKQFLDGLEQYKGQAGFAKEMQDILTPYKPFLASQGVNEQQAVKYLINAHYRLSNGTTEERQAAYRQIGQELGVLAKEAAAEAPVVDPAVKSLQDTVKRLDSRLSAEDRARQERVEADAAREVETFESDSANVYFTEVRQDMAHFVRQGMPIKDAYDKAVWANPVTRQKELNRIQTEAAANLKAKAKEEGNTARRTTSSNVRGVESRKAPTEPKGSIDDTLRETLKSIKNRAH